MAVFKHITTRPIPANAEVFTEKKIRYARWIDKRGKRHKERLNDAGTRLLCESKDYYGEYRTADGGLKRVRLASDRGAAESMLRELSRKAERQAAGLSDPTDDHAGTPLCVHLEDYLSFLQSRGRSEIHRSRVKSHIDRCLDAIDAIYPKDLTPERVQQWLSDARQGMESAATLNVTGTAKTYQGIADAFQVSVFTVGYWKRHGAPIEKRKKTNLAKVTEWLNEWKQSEGISAQTANNRLTSLKGFTNWMSRHHRIKYNPLASLSRYNVEEDRRHIRRSLLPDELRTLIAETEQSPARFGFDGNARAIMYRLASRTGFRRKELASLTPRSFDFKENTVSVNAGKAKNKRTAANPIGDELGGRVKLWIRERSLRLDVPLFPGLETVDTAEMIRGDLARVGIVYEDDDGRKFDFHALRVQLAADLARSGVPLTVAQKLMRHSDPKLTASVYTQLGIVDLQAAIDKLPSLDEASLSRETGNTA